MRKSFKDHIEEEYAGTVDSTGYAGSMVYVNPSPKEMKLVYDQDRGYGAGIITKNGDFYAFPGNELHDTVSDGLEISESTISAKIRWVWKGSGPGFKRVSPSGGENRFNTPEVTKWVTALISSRSFAHYWHIGTKNGSADRYEFKHTGLLPHIDTIAKVDKKFHSNDAPLVMGEGVMTKHFLQNYLTNPTRDQLYGYMKRTKDMECRWVIHNGDFYVWDAWGLIHSHFLKDVLSLHGSQITDALKNHGYASMDKKILNLLDNMVGRVPGSMIITYSSATKGNKKLANVLKKKCGMGRVMHVVTDDMFDDSKSIQRDYADAHDVILEDITHDLLEKYERGAYGLGYWSNPTSKEVATLIPKTSHGELRFICWKDNLYVWDAGSSTHVSFARNQLGLLDEIHEATNCSGNISLIPSDDKPQKNVIFVVQDGEDKATAEKIMKKLRWSQLSSRNWITTYKEEYSGVSLDDIGKKSLDEETSSPIKRKQPLRELSEDVFRSNETRYWIHPKKKKMIPLNLYGKDHITYAQDDPETYGFTQEDSKNGLLGTNRGWDIFGLETMFRAGWVRVIGRGNTLYLHGTTKDPKALYEAMNMIGKRYDIDGLDEIIIETSNINYEKYVSDPKSVPDNVRSGFPNYTNLRGKQIDIYRKTGRISKSKTARFLDHVEIMDTDPSVIVEGKMFRHEFLDMVPVFVNPSKEQIKSILRKQTHGNNGLIRFIITADNDLIAWESYALPHHQIMAVSRQGLIDRINGSFFGEFRAASSGVIFRFTYISETAGSGRNTENRNEAMREFERCLKKTDLKLSSSAEDDWISL